MTKNQEERVDKLSDLGLIFNGGSFVFRDINFHYTDLMFMSDKEFDKALKGAKERKKVLDNETKN